VKAHVDERVWLARKIRFRFFCYSCLAKSCASDIKRQKSISKHESYVVKALEKADEKLTMEVAERIAEPENSLAMEKETARY
jgi:hypothetical protein